jgi:hypothetical protein
VLLGSWRGERRRDVSGPALSESERALVAETWTFRAHAERSASLRFERLARELRQAEAPSVVIELAETAVTDEIRHAGLCDSLSQAYMNATWRPRLRSGRQDSVRRTASCSR